MAPKGNITKNSGLSKRVTIKTSTGNSSKSISARKLFIEKAITFNKWEAGEIQLSEEEIIELLRFFVKRGTSAGKAKAIRMLYERGQKIK